MSASTPSSPDLTGRVVYEQIDRRLGRLEDDLGALRGDLRSLLGVVMASWLTLMTARLLK